MAFAAWSFQTDGRQLSRGSSRSRACDSWRPDPAHTLHARQDLTPVARPRHLFVMIGTNDVAPTGGFSPAETVAGIRTVVQRIRSAHAASEIVREHSSGVLGRWRGQWTEAGELQLGVSSWTRPRGPRTHEGFHSPKSINLPTVVRWPTSVVADPLKDGLCVGLWICGAGTKHSTDFDMNISLMDHR